MEYLIHLGIISCIYAILGVSLNLVVGYAGLLSVTHAAFYGLGAYATGILMLSHGWEFFASMATGMAIAGVAAWFIAIVSGKFKGDYYALVSFGFNVIVFSVLLNWQSLTRGPLGIPGIPKPIVFGTPVVANAQFLVLSLVALACVYAVASGIVNSSFGRALKGIREDEDALRVFGYRVAQYKRIIFVIGAMFAAVAGSIFASYISYIDPSTFTLNESIFLLSIIILGGLANLRGSVAGAVFFILLPEILRFVGFPPDIAAQMRQVAYGVMLVLLMLYRPQGIFGEYKL
jgi:branched-chain amino acid transport system permease protein